MIRLYSVHFVKALDFSLMFHGTRAGKSNIKFAVDYSGVEVGLDDLQCHREQRQQRLRCRKRKRRE